MRKRLLFHTGKGLLLCSIALFFTVISSFAQTTATATSSGNWSSSATWQNGVIPAAGTAVTINHNVTVTVDIANAVCTSLQLGTASTGTATVNFNSGSQITISGTVRLGVGTGGGSGVINMANGGTLQCNGFSIANSSSIFTPGTGTVQLNSTNTLPASVVTSFNHLVINTGTTTAGAAMTIGGNLTIASGATFVGGSYIHSLAGNWINNGGTFQNTATTINFSGAAQTIGGSSATTFNHVSTSGGSNTGVAIGTTINGNFTVGNGTTFTAGAFALTVNGNLTVGGGSSGVFVINSATGVITFNGDISVSTGGLFDVSAANVSINIQGNLNNLGTFNAGSGVYTLTGSLKTISGTASLTSLSISGSYTNNGNLTLTNSLSGSGSLTNGASGTLNMNFSGLPGITTITAIAAGNTVNYGFAGAQTIKPVNYHHLTLNGSGTKTIQSGTTNIAGSFTLTGTVSAMASSGLTIANVILGNGTSLTTGSVSYTISGNWTNNGATVTATGSTFVFSGSSAAINGTATSQTFHHLTINKTLGQTLSVGGNTTTLTVHNFTKSNGNFSAPATFVINGNLSLSSGTFTAGAVINLAGNWSNNSGSFVHSNGTVNLTGGNQTLTGNQTFFNLSKIVTAAATFSFGSEQTQTILGTLTLEGAQGNLLTLASTVSDRQWRIDPRGARSVMYVSVSYSDNLHTTNISANYSTNGGNNNNWSYSNTIFWTGAVSTDWGTAANWKPASLPTTSTDVEIPASPSGGRFPVINTGTFGVRIMTIQAGATVSQAAGTLQVNNDWRNSGSFLATAGVVQFTATGASSANFASGTNNFYSVIVNNSVDPKFSQFAGSAISIAGNYTNNNATLASQTSNFTITFTGGNNQSIYSATSNSDFGRLVINKSDGTLSLASNIRVASNLTLTAGTFTTTTSNYSLTVNGSATFSGGSLALNGSTVSVSGNWINDGCTITGTTCSLTVTGNFTRNGGSLSTTGGSLSVGGNWVNNNAGVFSLATVTFTGTAMTISGTSATAFPALTVRGTVTMNASGTATTLTFPALSSSSSLSMAAGTSLTVNGNVTIQQPTNTATASLNVNAGTVTVNGNVTLGGNNTTSGRIARILLTTGTLAISGNLTFNAASGSSSLAVIDQSGGANTVYLGGNLTLTSGSGTITSGSSSKFVYNGSGNQTIKSISTIGYNSLIVDKPSGELTQTSSFSISGTFILENGNYSTSSTNYSFQAGTIIFNSGTFSANNSAITLTGNYTQNGGTVTGGTCSFKVGGNYTRNGGTFSVTNAPFTFTGTSKTIGGLIPANFGNLTFTTGTSTLNINATCTALTFSNNGSTNSLTLADNVSMTVNGDVNINQATSDNFYHTWFINNGNATVTGNLNFNVTNTNQNALTRVVVANGNLDILGNLVMNNTENENISVIDMSGGAGNINLHGNLSVQSRGKLTPGSSSTFTFAGSATQTFHQPSNFQYNIIRVNKTGGIVNITSTYSSSSASLQVDQGTFSIGNYSFGAKNYTLNGGVFSAGTGTVTVYGNWTNNGGSYSSTGTTTLRNGGAISGSAETTFGKLLIGSGSSKTMSNSNTCSSLSWESNTPNGTFTHAATASLKVNGAATLQQPSSSATHSWNINGGSATVTGLVNFAGTTNDNARQFRLVITTGTLNALGGITMASASTSTKIIDMTGGAGVINLKGALTVPSNSGTLTAGTAGSIFNYTDDVNAQTISFFPSGAYHNLHVNNTSTGGTTHGGTITTSNVTGAFRIQSGKDNNNGNGVTLATGKAFEVANGATYVIGGTTGMVGGTSVSKTFGSTSTVNFAGTTQTVSGESYGHLTISGSLTKTMSGNVTVRGTLTLSAGTFALGNANYTLTLNGAVVKTSGVITGSCSANITIGGTGNSTTMPGLSVNNFVLNRPAGISLSGNLTVCNSLTLTAGILKTSTSTVIMTGSATVSRSSGHVNGNLRKDVATGADVVRTFEVGGTVEYSPVVVTFGSVVTAGTLTAAAIPGNHPNINTSSVSMRKSAARYWTLTGSSLVFSTYNAVFNFANSDVDPGAITGNFIAGQYAANTWSYPTIGTRTANSTQLTNTTAFGEFQVGEFGSNSVKTWSGGAGTPNWSDAANWSPAGVPTEVDIVELTGANTININTNAVSSDTKLANTGLVLTVNSGVSYNINGNLTINNGTLNTAQAFPAVTETVVITGGTVGFTAQSGTQSIPAYEYNDLIISGGGTKTLPASILLSGNLTVNAGTLDLGAFTCDRFSEDGTLTIANGATLKIGGANGLPANYKTHVIATGSTIEYAGDNQSIAAPNSTQSYGTLAISGTGVKSLIEEIKAGNVTISAGALDEAGNNLTVTGNWTNNGNFIAGTGTVLFSGSTAIAGSSITTFKNLVVTGTLTAPSGTMKVEGNFTNNGTFQHNSGIIHFSGNSLLDGSSTSSFHNLVSSGQLIAPAGILAVSGNWTNSGSFEHNNGTVNFNGTGQQNLPALNYHHLASSSTGSRVLPATGIITINGSFTPGTNPYTITGSTFDFLSAGTQNIPAFTFFNLVVSGGVVSKTAAASFNVNGQLDLVDSVTLNMGAFVMGGTLSSGVGMGFLQTANISATPLPPGVNWEVEVIYNSASAQTIVVGNYNRLTTSGGNRTLAAGTVAIADVFTPGSGSFTVTGNTVDFNGAANQSIPVITAYNNLYLCGGGTIKTAAGNLTINGALTTAAGVVFDMTTFTLGGTLSSISGTGTVRTAHTTTAAALPLAKTWSGTVNYNSASAQTVVTGNYFNLTAEGGNRTLPAGTIGLAGTFATGTGVYTVSGTNTVVFNGLENQAIPAFTFQNLTINNTAETATLLGDVTVKGTLTFSMGRVVTDTFKVVLSSTGSVSGASQINGWIEGSLQRHFATGNNITQNFDVGGARFYSPVTVSMGSVSTAGTVICKAIAADHTGISTSGLSPLKSANRHWALTNTGTVFTNGTVTLNWVSGDVDVAANTSYFKVACYSGTAWSQPTSANAGPTSIQATGLTAFGDFIAGEMQNIIQWTGNVSEDWNAAGNWSPNAIPVAANDVTIPTAVTRFPVISSGTNAITDLVVEQGARLTVSSGTLKISGILTSAGSVAAANSTIELNGSRPQLIPAGTFENNLIESLIVNNSTTVTLEDSLKLTNLLSLKNGSLITNGYLVLISNADGTARVDSITSAAAMPINGTVTVERYVPGRRKYRLITSSVTTSTISVLSADQTDLSMWAFWQNSGNNAANRGTLITGGKASDGFDTQTLNASLFTYDGLNRKWIGYTSANNKNTKYTPLQTGAAYFLFVYGDRRNTINSASPNPTVLSATGTLATGTQTFTTSSAISLNNTAGGFTLLGNPFASTINWATLSRTNLENTFWGWDPNLSGTGGYVSVTNTGTVTLIAPFSGSVGLNQFIQSGQGFFVRTTAASPLLQIKESDKVGSVNNMAFRKWPKGAENPNSLPLIAINLFYDNAGVAVLADGVLAAFEKNFNKTVGSEDAVKIFPFAESVAIVNGADFVSIDARPLQVRDTLPLATNRLTRPQYTLEVFTQRLQNNNLQAFLEDKYLNTRQALSLGDTNRIAFTVSSSAPASADVNRFSIVFEPLVVLPLKFESVAAMKKDNEVVLNWAASEEAGVQKYIVQRSSDAVHFTAIGELAARGTVGLSDYSLKDIQPLKGLNYYRVQAVQKDGETMLSKTVSVMIEHGAAGVTIYPIPVVNGRINLIFNEVKGGNYTLILYNGAGQAVASKQLVHTAAVASYRLEPALALTSGIYYLAIRGEHFRYQKEIMVQ